MRISRNKIIEVAQELVNQQGLEALTTRRLADRLGVKGPALYRHFKNKQAIIDAMAVSLAAPLFPSEKQHWEEWFIERARGSRHKLLSSRDAARIVAMSQVRPGGRTDLEPTPLLAAGFDVTESMYIVGMLGRFIIGWTSAEQASGGRMPPFDTPVDADAAYEFGVQTMMAGLRSHLAVKQMQKNQRNLRPQPPAASRKTPRARKS